MSEIAVGLLGGVVGAVSALGGSLLLGRCSSRIESARRAETELERTTWKSLQIRVRPI